MPPLAAAGIDIGTNSLLLAVARPTPRGFDVLEERCVVTRLGEGLGARGSLKPEAIERTLAALTEFGSALVALSAEASAAGTSALRRAVDAQVFLEKAEAALGVPVRVLSGAQEARLSYAGALVGLEPLGLAAMPVVIDTGGGSVEVMAGPEKVTSLEVGAVRLTEDYVRSDPPARDELDAMTAHARRIVAQLPSCAGGDAVAVGGTATTLMALAQGLTAYERDRVHGHRLSLAQVVDLGRDLASLSLAERAAHPCLPPGRADIIVAGAVLLEEVLRRLGLDQVVVSDRGLRWGLLCEVTERWRASRTGPSRTRE